MFIASAIVVATTNNDVSNREKEDEKGTPIFDTDAKVRDLVIADRPFSPITLILGFSANNAIRDHALFVRDQDSKRIHVSRRPLKHELTTKRDLRPIGCTDE